MGAPLFFWLLDAAMPFDFAAVSAPFRMQPGLRRIVPGARQLTPNRHDSVALREKLSALQHHAPLRASTPRPRCTH